MTGFDAVAHDTIGVGHLATAGLVKQGRGLFFPGRPQVQVVLQQLPQQLAATRLKQFLQLGMGQRRGPLAGKLGHHSVEDILRPRKQVSSPSSVVRFHRALLSADPDG
jgi:hypothetical protein